MYHGGENVLKLLHLHPLLQDKLDYDEFTFYLNKTLYINFTNSQRLWVPLSQLRIKNRITVSSSNPTSEYISKNIKISISKRHIQPIFIVAYS